LPLHLELLSASVAKSAQKRPSGAEIWRFADDRFPKSGKDFFDVICAAKHSLKYLFTGSPLFGRQ
jgi:hypothetical protein